MNRQRCTDVVSVGGTSGADGAWHYESATKAFTAGIAESAEKISSVLLAISAISAVNSPDYFLENVRGEKSVSTI